MNRIHAFASRRSTQAAAALAAVVSIVAFPSLAGADTVASAFASETTSLGGYIALGATLVVTLMATGLGIALLVKWSKRGVHAT